MFTEEQKLAILERLHSRLMANRKPMACPMCGHRFFTLADAYVHGQLHVDIRKAGADGPILPMFALICDCCGFVSLHAVGTVGLFPDATKDARDTASGETAQGEITP